MKKSLLISTIVVLGLTSSSFATTSPDAGVYMGLSGGFGMLNLQNTEGSVARGYTLANTYGDHGFVSRVFVGYDINKYFALESGYSYFFADPYGDFINSKGRVNRITTSNYMNIDLYGKGKLPLINNFDLYAKLGANLLVSRVDNFGVNNKNNINMSFGAGVDYRITSKVTANCEWLRFNGNAKINNIYYQPNADVFLLGLRYKFDL